MYLPQLLNTLLIYVKPAGQFARARVAHEPIAKLEMYLCCRRR